MVTNIDTRLLGRNVSFTVSEPWLAYWLVIMRLAVGWWMLHAGLDKFLAWPFDAGWFVGGAAAGTSLGPLVTLFSEGVALSFVNVMVPLGQTLIGLGLLFGALTRLAAFFGAVLMTFFYFINGETGGWEHGLVTGDLLGLLIFAMIATLGAGRVLGVDAYLARSSVFKNHPKLQWFIG
ncbi:DoxX family protein [Halopenitus sp. H-Gu1]|uniref:DoxX family protein n=1 Tax=Halopenitus sp. H-Gu1 TaxID=3242697 RepID=UPI00359E8527